MVCVFEIICLGFPFSYYESKRPLKKLSVDAWEWNFCDCMQIMVQYFVYWGFGLETFPGQPYLQFHIALEPGKCCLIPRSSSSPVLDRLQCLRCPVSNWKMEREDPGDVNSSKNLTCSLETKRGNVCTSKTCQTLIPSPSPNLPAEIIKFIERSRRNLLHETCTPCRKMKKLLLSRQKIHCTAHSPRIHWFPNIKYVFYF